jgi:hypothetical protein
MSVPLSEEYKKEFNTRDWLHYLWGKAVGTPAYQKSDWQEFRILIEGLLELERTHDEAINRKS